MNFADVQAQINDLPTTFKRQGAPYTQLIDALTGGLTDFTVGADGTMSQVASFDLAQGGWLDVWGLLFLIPRDINEGDGPYAIRIRETVLAWVATLPALQRWIDLFAAGGTVREDPTGLGYTITLPPTLSAKAIAEFIENLNRIRPIGVPFILRQATGGLFLGTEAFLGTGRVQGSYLTEGTNDHALAVSALTNSARVMLPDLYLTDPVLSGAV